MAYTVEGNDLEGYDLSRAVHYHYGKFPPTKLEPKRLVEPMALAQDALSRYDQMLLSLPNSELLLAPLRYNEAVISSRMEDTVSTVDEVLIHEADANGVSKVDAKGNAFEVSLYTDMLRRAQAAVSDGHPIDEGLIKNAHKCLLGHGRGATKSPGVFKAQQNYIGNDLRKLILFKPIDPIHLQPAMSTLLDYIENSPMLPLLKVAIAHVEFEALHPFNDGNGRLGRLLVALLLWKFELVHKPHFNFSAYLEEHKDTYCELMRAVSRDDDWTGWTEFFLNAITFQAELNLNAVSRIAALHEEMKEPFRDISRSSRHMAAQDSIFETPIFKTSQLAERSGIPKHAATRIVRLLHEGGLLRQLRPASGHRGALYKFEPLLDIVRA
ncbi:MAG: Fic family protein [Rhodobacteraceae bacterium]|nr:Fic family protein [Paracoccaceae bacterium]